MKWEEIELGKVLDYEQPTKYIVDSSEYTENENDTPVLTAGKTFILGYTTEKKGIFKDDLPVIIFDDFTTATKFVDFSFKVKSSAMKILHADQNIADTKYLYYVMQNTLFKVRKHKRHWISEYSKIKVLLPPLPEQKKIAHKLDELFSDINKGEESLGNNKLLIKNLFGSYLQSAFQQDEIDEVKLGSICTISGGFGFPHAYQGRRSEKYPFYKVSDMNTEGNEVYMKSHNNSVSEDDVKKLKLKIYPAGTIIFPKIGAAIATNKKRILTVPSTVDNNVMALIPNENISSKYLYNYLLNLDLSDWASKAALPSIRKSVVEEAFISIPMKNGSPDYDAQEKFAESITTFQEKIARLEQLSQANSLKLKELRTSVLDYTLQPKTAPSPILSPIQVAIPQLSDLQQAIGLTLKRFPRGEMVVAKVLYLAQSIFKVPLGVSFTQQAFGPYSFDIKTAIDDGLSSQKGIFVKKGTKGMEVLSLSTVGTNALNQLSGGVKKPMEDYLNVMMPLYFSSKSNSIELLATICKIIEDENTSDDQVIYKKLQKWKPNKFGDSEIYRTISLIKKQKWDQKILQV